MRIRTLSDIEFTSYSRELADYVIRSGFHPDILIGIARGGDYVAEAMELPIPRFSIKCQRTGTKTKSRFLPNLLRRTPRFICDALRIAESSLYALRERISPTSQILLDESIISEELLNALQRKQLKILIADDAVDSGHTLLAVRQLIERVSNNAEIRTAVITVTRKRTAVRPDFSLFPVGTIVRFPWAPDVKSGTR